MYSQGLRDSQAGDDSQELLDAFQVRIDNEEKIEPRDWMPKPIAKH